MRTFIEDLSPGCALGRYTLDECVGRGGHAEVWRARDPDTGSRIALKIMRSRDLEDYARFRQEAQVQQRLRHPNVVAVHGLRQVDGLTLLELEYIPGRTLLEWLTRYRPTTLLCETWILQILDGLEAAHDMGVLHRDIKPSNILIDESSHPLRVKLADFGIARIFTEPTTELTGSGVALGTPGYMAPEQIRGLAQLDPRVDLFALGALAYRLLTGRAPFGGGNHFDVFNRTCMGEYASLREVAPDLPERFIRTIQASLSVQPDARPANAAAFRAMWTGALEGPSVEPAITQALLLPAPPLEAVSDAPTLRTNRRVHHDRFHGRIQELHHLMASIMGSEHRILTLKGPGGVGKTRLADEALGLLNAADWAGGVWRCNLTATQTAQEVLEAIRAVFDLRLPKDAPVQRLGEALRARGRCVLMLDNLEQVIDPAAELVEQISTLAPELTILATSRIVMGLQSERVFALEAIDTPSAVALFVDRARSARPGFHPTDDELSTIQALVEQLDALPLAVELAASRLRVLDLPALVAHLASGRGLSGRRRRGTESRHSSLDEAISSSWSLLQPYEQLALAQCSVFRGGFTIDAVEEVLCLDAFPDSPWAVDVVESLMDQSLLRLEQLADGVQRFDLYASIRDFAHKQLQRPGAVRSPTGERLTGPQALFDQMRRHAAYYARFGHEEHFRKLRGKRAAAQLQAMARELPNFTAAHHFDPRSKDPALAELPSRAGFIAALVLLRTGQTHAALPILAQAWAQPGIGPDTRALIGANLTVVQRQLGQLQRALDTIAESLAAIPEGTLPARRARLLQHQGNITRQMGDFDGARRYLTQAREQVEAVGDPGPIGQVIGDLGSVALYLGELDEAEQLLRTAMKTHQDCEMPDAANISRGLLGELAIARGDLSEARRLFQASLDIAKARNYRRQELIFLIDLAEADLRDGALEAAQEHFEAALTLNEAVGDRRRQGRLVAGLGELDLLRGEPLRGRRRLEEATLLADGVDPPTTTRAHSLLALQAARAGRRDDAAHHMNRAFIHAGAGGPPVVLKAMCQRVATFVALGDAEAARAQLAEIHDDLDLSSLRCTPLFVERLTALGEQVDALG